MDPVVEVVPAKGQVEHLLGQVKATIAQGHRVLVTTLTKRMAEDLTRVLSRARFEGSIPAFRY